MVLKETGSKESLLTIETEEKEKAVSNQKGKGMSNKAVILLQ